MLELGPRAEALHEELGAFIAANAVDLLLLYGPLSEATRRGAVAAGFPAERALHFATREALAEALRGRLHAGDRVLVKGSRGMAMEKVIELIEKDLPPRIAGHGDAR
jgi:UDP-N-acetylmuramoyl-tripeptide--D-alanyl-D-alanine ligase